MALKAWDSKGWTQQLSKSTIVSIADDDVGAEPDKPMWIYIGQTERHPPVRGPRGVKHLVLLSRDEARALAEYLVETLDTLDQNDEAAVDLDRMLARRRKRK